MLLRVANIVPVSDMTASSSLAVFGRNGPRVRGPLVLGISNVSNADAGRPVETRTQVGRYSVEQGSSGCLPFPMFLSRRVAALNDTGTS